jgi:uncharacterized protein
MQLVPFSPVSSLAGGVLVGVSAAIVLLVVGRTAGLSGIIGGLFRRGDGDGPWRVAFVSGLAVVGFAASALWPQQFAVTISRSSSTLAVAGLLVGFGTRLGSGCTSGHGVCGISRVAPRSIAATVTFIAAGVVTVLLYNHFIGGAR